MVEFLLSDPPVNASASVLEDDYDDGEGDDGDDGDGGGQRKKISTALHASSSGGHLDAVVLLVKLGGADATAVDGEGRTATEVAGGEEVEQFLRAVARSKFHSWEEMKKGRRRRRRMVGRNWVRS